MAFRVSLEAGRGCEPDGNLASMEDFVSSDREEACENLTTIVSNLAALGWDIQAMHENRLRMQCKDGCHEVDVVWSTTKEGLI